MVQVVSLRIQGRRRHVANLRIAQRPLVAREEPKSFGVKVVAPAAEAERAAAVVAEELEVVVPLKRVQHQEDGVGALVRIHAGCLPDRQEAGALSWGRGTAHNELAHIGHKLVLVEPPTPLRTSDARE